MNGSGAVQQVFQYDGAAISTELNASNVITKRYVWGPGEDEPLVQYEGADFAARRYLVADERGSVIAINSARLYTSEQPDIDFIGARRERRNRLGVALQFALL